ncbi:recombinase RecA, partial [Streptococcus dysgalactiae]
MERRVRRKFHARCGAGEKSEVATPEIYLSL